MSCEDPAVGCENNEIPVSELPCSNVTCGQWMAEDWMEVSLLPHFWQNLPIIIKWMGPLSFLGASGVIFNFYFIFR